MLKRSLTLLAAVCVMMPMLAYSWSLTTRINSAGGQLQVRNQAAQTATGSVLKNYTTHQNVAVLLTATTGYKISKVQKNGAYVTPVPTANPQTYQLGLQQSSSSSQSIGVWFDKQLYPVSAGVGPGGSVSPSGTLNLQLGQVKTYTFTPNSGKNVVAITGLPSGATVMPAVPAPVNVPVSVTFAVPASAVNLNGVFVGVTANAGAPQTILPGSTTLDATASVNNAGTGTPTYSWTETSGPAPVVLAAVARPSFTATVPGTYNFQLTFSNGVSSATSSTSVIVTDSPTQAAKDQCVACHTGAGVGAGVYEKWAISSHSTNAVMCYTCHVGTNTGGHPGSTVTVAACEGCHSAGLSQTTHPAELTAQRCISCHNSHDPAEGIANLGPAPAHPAVTLYTFEEIGMQMAGGAPVPVQVDANGKGMPYSPKQTCGTSGCHVKNGVDYTYDKISDHAFHSNEGRSEYQDASDGKFNATKSKPWTQSTAMVGKW